MFSCNQPKENMKTAMQVDSLSVSSKKIQSTDSIPLLQSYYLSSSYPYNDSLVIMGYNFKAHALDIFSSVSMLDRIQLDHHGENGILGRPVAITPISKDSIWIFDQVAFYLIDSHGKVLHKHKEDKYVFLDTNYAMQTALMGWYDHDLLLYPVEAGGKYYVYFYSLSKKKVVKEIKLDFPESNKDGKNSYADMRCPNVTFANNKIIYNYPYENSILTIDISTGERHVYNIKSEFAENSLSPYKGPSDMQAWLEYDWSNPHFFEVSYIPQADMYVRFMLDGIDTKEYKEQESIVDARRLYIAFLDKDFHLIGEFPLQEKRYSNFHGWCVLSNSVVVYVDNLLGKVQDNLAFDVIVPIEKKNTK